MSMHIHIYRDSPTRNAHKCSVCKGKSRDKKKSHDQKIIQLQNGMWTAVNPDGSRASRTFSNRAQVENELAQIEIRSGRMPARREDPLGLSRKQFKFLRSNDAKQTGGLIEAPKVGQTGHLGFGAKGGAGFRGTVVWVGEGMVEIEGQEKWTFGKKRYKGPARYFTPDAKRRDAQYYRVERVGPGNVWAVIRNKDNVALQKYNSEEAAQRYLERLGSIYPRE
jgi:hypothetical protein